MIDLAARQDYPAFFETEYALRRILTYPPFCDIYGVFFVSEDENAAALAAKAFFDTLVLENKEQQQKLIVLGPSPARISKISNTYRYRLAIKCKNSKSVRNLLMQVLKATVKMKELRKELQIIFQDPYSALDPHQNVREIMAEPISVFEKLPEKEMDERIVSLLEKVGMKADDMEKYAYEFSGGQRQRIGIARALSVNPEFLLCDEPISALDVSIQAQVVNVLEDLQQELGLTYLFVAHDLSMVRHISDRIGVMYLGKIVESGDSDEVYDNPCHPYTRALLASIPIADPKRALSLEHCGIEGDLPSPLHVPSGCRFHTRCPYAIEQCRQQEPELEERTPGHMVACWKK